MNLYLIVFVCIFVLRFCTTYPTGKKIEVEPGAPTKDNGVILYFFDMQNHDLQIFLEKLDRILALLEKSIPQEKGVKPEPDVLLSRQETAELLKVSLQTVQNYIDNGTLPAHRVGTRIRLKKYDVLNALHCLSPKRQKGGCYVK